MGKIIYNLFHGNTKTRLYLWSLLLMGIAAIVCFVVAVAKGQWIYGGIAVVLLASIFILSQSFSLKSTGKRKLQKTQGARTGNAGGQRNLSFPAQENKEASLLQENEKNEYIFLGYDQKKMKKLFRQYKVRREHKTIIIDRAPLYKIRECPAFVWREGKNLHLLLLEKEPRALEIPLEKIKTFGYHSKVEANPQKEYGAFRLNTLVARVFKEYLPSYQESVENGKQIFYKNLYTAGKEFEVTNNSIAELMSILDVPFVVDDQLTRGNRYSGYFKRAYEQSILCKDMVITRDQFTKQMDMLLDEMAEANITGSEFRHTLQELVRCHYITREMAISCQQKWNK